MREWAYDLGLARSSFPLHRDWARAWARGLGKGQSNPPVRECMWVRGENMGKAYDESTRPTHSRRETRRAKRWREGVERENIAITRVSVPEKIPLFNFPDYESLNPLFYLCCDNGKV